MDKDVDMGHGTWDTGQGTWVKKWLGGRSRGIGGMGQGTVDSGQRTADNGHGTWDMALLSDAAASREMRAICAWHGVCACVCVCLCVCVFMCDKYTDAGILSARKNVKRNFCALAFH